MFGNKETKEQKQARKEAELLEKYGLQFMFDPDNINSVKRICSDLAGSGMMYWGGVLSGDVKALTQVSVAYQKAIFEQNMIIIRQLDRIAEIAKVISNDMP